MEVFLGASNEQSDPDSDPEAASFTILASKTQLLGASNHSGAGLRWCKKELDRVHAITGAFEPTPSSLCDLCAEVANSDAFIEFPHQPGYAALAFSAQTCIICHTIWMSLDGITKYIHYKCDTTTKKLDIFEREEKDKVSAKSGSGNSLELTKQEPGSSDSIVLSTVMVDPLHLEDDGQRYSLLNSQIPSFISHGLERYRRFTVVWKGQKFHWTGDIIGISISALNRQFYFFRKLAYILNYQRGYFIKELLEATYMDERWCGQYWSTSRYCSRLAEGL
jgi:hypothetical protein